MKKKLLNILTPVFILCLFTSLQAQEYGMASYYSDDYQGRKTAYGETYNKSKLTAAHKKHPYGTQLKITRLDNKKSVRVTVNDKGPYIKGRVVELSRRAAEEIGLIKDGLTEVRVDVIKRGSKEPVEDKKVSSSSSRSSSKKKEEPDSFEAKSPAKTVKNTSSKSSSSKSSSSSSKETAKSGSSSKSSSKKSSSSKARLVKQDYTQYGLYKIELRKPKKEGYGVQIVSLTSYENVLKQVAELQAKWFDNILVSVERGGNSKPVYKIILGPLEDEKAAKNYKDSLKRKHKISGFIVNLDDLSY